jgi:uncharacterized membrane protein
MKRRTVLFVALLALLLVAADGDTEPWQWVAVPAGLGTLVTAILGILKYFGIIKDGTGGKWAVGADIVLAAALTFVVNVFGFDMSGDLATQINTFALLIGQLLMMIVGSYLSHYVSKKAEVYSSPLRSR